MELGLKGRTALVTGASKGMGRAIAIAFATEGANLILVARSTAELEAVRSEITQVSSVSVAIFALDLTISASIAELSSAGSEVDILVNNAGAIPPGGLAETDEDLWRNAWDLKVFGYINMCRAFYALMKARGGGVIINIIGVAGERVDASYICGSTANAALMAFTRALGGESHRDGIRVVGINPGAVTTERMELAMRKAAQDRFGNADDWERFVAPLPFQRGGTPEEIAQATLFLASDMSSYTTGTILTIDGGMANAGTRL